MYFSCFKTVTVIWICKIKLITIKLMYLFIKAFLFEICLLVTDIFYLFLNF